MVKERSQFNRMSCMYVDFFYIKKKKIVEKDQIKWDHFEILASGQCDLQCKSKETLSVWDLKPALNENVGSEKLFLY